jgi:hypothetical protein
VDNESKYKGRSQANQKSYRVVDIMMSTARPEWDSKAEFEQRAEFETAIDDFEAAHGTFKEEHGTFEEGRASVPRTLCEDFSHPEGFDSLKQFVHERHGIDREDIDKKQPLLKVRVHANVFLFSS